MDGWSFFFFFVFGGFFSFKERTMNSCLLGLFWDYRLGFCWGTLNFLYSISFTDSFCFLLHSLFSLCY